MKILGLSVSTIVFLFVAFYLGTRYPNALKRG